MTRPRIFIPNMPLRLDQNGEWVPSVNLTGADEFGDLVFCFDGRVPPHMFYHNVLRATVQQMQNALASFNESDIILPLGHPLLIAAAYAYATERVSNLNVLVHDRMHGYSVHKLEFNFELETE